MKQILLSVAILAGLSICSCKTSIKDPIDLFSKPQNIGYKVLNIEEQKVLNPHKIHYTDEKLVLFDFKNEFLMDIINLKDLSVTEFGKRGNGPYEMISPFSIMSKGKEIYVYDIILSSLVKFHTDSIFNAGLAPYKSDFCIDG